MVYGRQALEYVIDEVEESIKRSKKIKDDGKAVILQEIQGMKSILIREIVPYLPNETSVSSLKDSGHGSPNSRPSTPIKPPPLPQVECVSVNAVRVQEVAKYNN